MLAEKEAVLKSVQPETTARRVLWRVILLASKNLNQRHDQMHTIKVTVVAFSL